jgi:hypothetical protein
MIDFIKIFNVFRKIRMISDGVAFYTIWKKSGYLQEIGWFESFHRLRSVNRKNEVLPWFTYPAIAFLTGRAKPDFSVFEFGSGHSTLWWSQRVKKVVSVEHDLDWYQQIKPQLADHVIYFHAELGTGKYAQAVTTFEREFDIIVIDGRDRVNCAKNCLNGLKEDGVIIWDNSDRAIYQEGYDYLLNQGFKRLDFLGMGPIASHGWCTSVFYRVENCLGL